MNNAALEVFEGKIQFSSEKLLQFDLNSWHEHQFRHNCNIRFKQTVEWKPCEVQCLSMLPISDTKKISLCNFYYQYLISPFSVGKPNLSLWVM